VSALAAAIGPMDVSAQRVFPAAEESALELRLGDGELSSAAVEPPGTFDGYTLRELQSRVKRARLGLIGIAAIGGVTFGAGLAAKNGRSTISDFVSSGRVVAAYAGAGVMLGGAVGMNVSGTLLGKRKKRLQDARHLAAESR